MCKIYSMSRERVVHHIFCSGSIGVGKTTTLEYLKKRLVGMDSIYFVKEYIDYDPEGKQMLERSLDGSITLVDFQLYICDQFYFQLEKFYSDIHTDCAFCIWERHPMEALEIFARDLSGDDKITVRNAIIKMLEQFNVPDMNGHEITDIVSFGGYNDLEIVTQSNATDCKADLNSSEYMIIHAHGDIVSYANIIELDKYGDTCLFSYDSINLSGQSKYLGSNSNEDYSNLKLVLFMNCHSGETDFNFVSRIVDLGAKNAIGFIGKQDEDKAEEWQQVFWKTYCAGNTIDTCIRIACAESGILYSDVVVGGNVSNTIWKQTTST